MINIVSLKQRPEIKTELIEYVLKFYNGSTDNFFEQIELSTDVDERVQDTFVLCDDDRIIGFYQFIHHEPIRNTESTPWLSALYIDEGYRGHRLSEWLILHSRMRAGKLGYGEIYVSTDLINFFEKFGFHEIGLDLDKWGYPSKVYVAGSLLL